jgi:hypothetical protein
MKQPSLEQRVLHDFYEGKTVKQLVDEYDFSHTCNKQQACEKIYEILKNGALAY